MSTGLFGDFNQIDQGRVWTKGVCGQEKYAQRGCGRGIVDKECVCVCVDIGCTLAHPPPETANEAGGTHPTGMHSCYVYYFKLLAKLMIRSITNDKRKGLITDTILYNMPSKLNSSNPYRLVNYWFFCLPLKSAFEAH